MLLDLYIPGLFSTMSKMMFGKIRVFFYEPSVYGMAYIVRGYGDFVDIVGQSEDFNYDFTIYFKPARPCTQLAPD